MSTLKVSSLSTPDGSYTVNIADIATSATVNLGGSNTAVQFNDANTLAGSNAFTFNKTSNTVSITNLTVSGNLNGNAISALNANTANVANSALALSANVANVSIVGAADGQYLQANGTGGNVKWATINTDKISNGNSNVLVDGTNANVNADLNVSGNAVITGNLTVNGTTTTVNSTTVSTNDKNIVLANNATTAAMADGAGITINGANASIAYNNTSNRFDVSHKLTANITGAAATVTSNAQPNITSLGTLSGLTVGGITSLGPVANISITGGNAANGAQYLKTDGNGILSWGIGSQLTSVGITPGSGIGVSGSPLTSSGTITVTNNGVVSIIAGNGISTTSSNGNPTISATVAGITAGNGITDTVANGVHTLKANVVDVAAGSGIQVTSASGTYTIKANVVSITTGNGITSTNTSGAVSFSANVVSIAAGNGIQSSATSGAYTLKANVANVVAGTAMTVSANSTSGVYTVTNNGVTSVSAGSGISVDTTTGDLTVSVGTFTFAKEAVSVVTGAPPSTININALSQSVVYYSDLAINDVTLNIRGDASTTLDSKMSNGESTTVTFILTNGGSFTAKPIAFKVDGATVTPKWAGGQSPVASANSMLSVSLTMIKTATNTFTVLGSFTGFF